MKDVIYTWTSSSVGPIFVPSVRAEPMEFARLCWAIIICWACAALPCLGHVGETPGGRIIAGVEDFEFVSNGSWKDYYNCWGENIWKKLATLRMKNKKHHHTQGLHLFTCSWMDFRGNVWCGWWWSNEIEPLLSEVERMWCGNEVARVVTTPEGS